MKFFCCLPIFTKSRLEMDEDQPGQGSGQISRHLLDMEHFLNRRNLFHLLQIDLVSKEIFKYLDGSALINLSSVNKEIRHVVTSSPQFKNKVNLMVNIKYLDFFTNRDSLPHWTAHLTHLTLICDNSQLGLMSQDKFYQLTRTLPSLSTLLLLNDSESYYYATTFINKILKLSPNLKSLSIPYDLMLNYIDFQKFFQNLKELKFTTTSCKSLQSRIKNKKYSYLYENLEMLATNCINLKSFSCQELIKVHGRYTEVDEDYDDFYSIILIIIENNSNVLEKLEFGISSLVVRSQGRLHSKFSKILLQNLKYLDLRGVMHQARAGTGTNHYMIAHQSVLDILKNNIPQDGQLTTLKLTLVRFPFELFDLIPQKFLKLKSLSLKASTFTYGDGINKIDWSFLQSLTKLEELEITKFATGKDADDFGLAIFKKFPEYGYFLNDNLRKLSLKEAADKVCNASTLFTGISKLSKLKELSLTGTSPLYLEDFIAICKNLKGLEKLEISNLHCDKFNSKSDAGEEIIDYSEILTEFSSLKYLKELSVELWSGDFRKVLGAISFPYLKTLTLCNANLDQNEIENIVRLNGMLKNFSIVTLKDVEGDYPDQNFEIRSKRKNLKIDFSFKQMEINPKDRDDIVRDDCDPDSKPFDMQMIFWSDSSDDEFFGYDDSDSDSD